MTWQAFLNVRYTLEQGRSTARYLHDGPLRILQTLYPEGEAICHNVLVHPPGGLVGGDRLDIRLHAADGAHALLTTPGASRFYRSDGETALQHTRIQLDAGARLEWLPLEALCYPGCLAENRLQLELAPGAEMMGWDITALGLPAAGQAFDSGRFCQHLEMPGVWLERGVVAAADTLLLDSRLGLNGHHCMATLFFCAGTALARGRLQNALDCARVACVGQALENSCGVTSPNGQVLVLRVLSPLVEPAMQLLRRVWGAWRQELWQLPAPLPRIWAT
jgi:urease accessory protein